MENASKALVMAAEILFGVMLLGLFISTFYAWNNFTGNLEDNMELANIQEFNSKFEIYLGRDDLTPHDVVTMVKLANEYNAKVEEDAINFEYKHFTIDKVDDFIKQKVNPDSTRAIPKYKCSKIKYNQKTGIVEKVTIESNGVFNNS